MSSDPTITIADRLALAQVILPAALLALFWTWETWWPFFGWSRRGRLRHAARNLGLGMLNAVVIGLAFGALTVMVARWTERAEVGLLNAVPLADPLRVGLALVLLDGWMYVWHRANHASPLLWRFHRMHHGDPSMDVTTGARFHLGELAASSILRLAVIPLLGIDLVSLLLYDAIAIAMVHVEHADVDLGRCDRWLRLLIVTPRMHKVHHSRLRGEADSNFSTVLSVWDRVAGTFRLRSDPRTLVLGLDELSDPAWQTFRGLWKTPFASPGRSVSRSGTTTIATDVERYEVANR